MLLQLTQLGERGRGRSSFEHGCDCSSMSAVLEVGHAVLEVGRAVPGVGRAVPGVGRAVPEVGRAVPEVPTTAIPTGALRATGGVSGVGDECVTAVATGALGATGAASGMHDF